mgnify:CR=1 FL=1
MVFRFRPDGQFRVLMVSDIQETADSSTHEASFAAVRSLIVRERPDLIVLGGDNCDEGIETPDGLRAYLDLMTAPMEEAGVPWIFLFGNHDHDLPFDDAEKAAIYESYPHCIAARVPGLSGTTNFCLPILRHDSDCVAYAVWGLDSGNRPRPELARYAWPNGWDCAHFDQLMWYYEGSRRLEAENGGKVPGILLEHIPLYEHQIPIDHPDFCGTVGCTSEHLALSYLNNGLLSCMVDRGDIRAFCCGHNHDNNFEADWCGIRLCYAGSAGYYAYGDNENRGARLFVLSEDGSLETRFCPHEPLSVGE